MSTPKPTRQRLCGVLTLPLVVGTLGNVVAHPFLSDPGGRTFAGAGS